MSSDAASPHDEPEPAPEVTVAPTHGALTEVDPWAEDAERRAPWMRGLAGVREVLDVVILALVMLIAVRSVSYNYIVDGPSMQPTFHDGEFVIVNRLAYREFDFSWLPGVDEAWQPFGEPAPGDVVVFTQVSSGIAKDLIKRVIAVPGQTVEVRDGAVFVDGVRLDEAYTSAPADYQYPATVIPSGTLWVLGDNRINSADSHLFGPIEVSQVVGRADLRYWPLDELGRIEHVLGNQAEGTP